ncbi:MAG: YkgJ family cysteine cluster protein [Gemmatimonadales bacterium]
MRTLQKQDQEPWYHEGLRFECTRCGHCCGGAPGTVRITADEAGTIAEYLNISPAQFVESYTQVVNVDDLILNDRPDHSCILYDSAVGCTVYPHRPRQCRTWPFWQSVVGNPQRWADEARECPGMNRGKLHSRECIQDTAGNDGTFRGAPPAVPSEKFHASFMPPETP